MLHMLYDIDHSCIHSYIITIAYDYVRGARASNPYYYHYYYINITIMSITIIIIIVVIIISSSSSSSFEPFSHEH